MLKVAKEKFIITRGRRLGNTANCGREFNLTFPVRETYSEPQPYIVTVLNTTEATSDPEP